MLYAQKQKCIQQEKQDIPKCPVPQVFAKMLVPKYK